MLRPPKGRPGLRRAAPVPGSRPAVPWRRRGRRSRRSSRPRSPVPRRWPGRQPPVLP